MNELTFVFHVGPHKTATTYIQEHLHAARKTLAKRGWVYPCEGTAGLTAHHELAMSGPEWVEEDGAGYKQIQDLAAHKPRQNIVFSAEAACRWSVERFHRFGDIFDRRRIDIVFAIRDPIDLFYSQWSEEIKQGYTLGLGDRFAQHFAAPLSNNVLNPLLLLKPFLKDGRFRVHAIPFEVLARQNIDIYEHFCETVLGLSGMSGDQTKPRNSKLPIQQTEFLRLLTLREAAGQRWIGSSLRQSFFRETTAEQRRELGQLVLREGSSAFRRISFPARVQFKSALEKLMYRELAGSWTTDPGGAPLFRHEEQSYVYYDTFLLMQSPAVRDAVEEWHTRLTDVRPEACASA